MKASGAAGPGGWRVPELKSLPSQAWVEFQWLTHLYETSGFPEALRELYVTLIPKSDQTSCPEPHDVRPIAVASSVYRAYSRAKSQTLREAVNSYLSPCQHGAREGHSLQQAVSSVLARVEEAKCHHQSHNHQWHGFSLDISKCFDTLPSCAIEEILTLTGIDQTVAARIQQMVTGMRRRWRLPGRCLSRHIEVQRGLPQGCSLSVLVANLYMSLLVHHIMENSQGRTEVSAYCDDVLVMARTPEDVWSAWAKVEQFAKTMQIAINVKKSFAFSTDPDVTCLWKQGAAPGNLQTVTCFKYLGVYIDTTMEQVEQQEVADAHLQKAKSSLSRVKALPMGLEQRSQIAAASTMMSLTFAPWGWTWSVSQWKAMRNQVMAAIQGSMRRKARAAAEVMFTVLVKGHRVEPTMATATSAMAWLLHLCRHEPDRMQTIGAALMQQQMAKGGMIAQLMQKISACGLTMTRPWRWQAETGEVFDIEVELGGNNMQRTWHKWRECLRAQTYSNLVRRRPVYEGIHGLCRKRTLKLYNKLDTPQDQGIFCTMLLDSMLTRARIFAGEEEQRCDLCLVQESVQHVLWECPRWQGHRHLSHQQCHQLPSATYRCGIVLRGAPAGAEVAQAQIFAICKSYILWRAENVQWPRGPPRYVQATEPWIPVRRVLTKTPCTQISMMPPRPRQGPWKQNGHVGECVRRAGAWKAVCHCCKAQRDWHRRGRMPQCPLAHKGARVRPMPGFLKVQRGPPDHQWVIECSQCQAQALWCSRRRFESRHKCKKGNDGQPVRRVRPAMREHQEEVMGFYRRQISLSSFGWICATCKVCTKTRQALAQTWCKWPEHCSRYMYRQ